MSKILLAEDGLITAFHLKKLLEKYDHQVIAHVTKGEEVFDQFEKIQPDLLLLDIMLEGYMNGVEAAQKVRAISEVPIIFMSALTDDETLEEINKISNCTTHNKPFEEDSLIKEVEKMLAKK
jgi:DNA-binding response OmpR family regulator